MEGQTSPLESPRAPAPCWQLTLLSSSPRWLHSWDCVQEAVCILGLSMVVWSLAGTGLELSCWLSPESVSPSWDPKDFKYFYSRVQVCLSFEGVDLLPQGLGWPHRGCCRTRPGGLYGSQPHCDSTLKTKGWGAWAQYPQMHASPGRAAG